jgi:hypothetical protein
LSKRGDHGHLPTNQLSRQFRQPIVSVLGPVVLDAHVLAIDETDLAQAALESIRPQVSLSTTPALYSFTLGHPRQTASMGGGHAVWIFADGVLTMLRTYKVGGFKMSIAFARHETGLTCSIEAPHAREVGAGNIRRESAFGGSWEIISAKQISSSCKIRKD